MRQNREGIPIAGRTSRWKRMGKILLWMVLILVAVSFCLPYEWSPRSWIWYSGEHFGVETVLSGADFNQNGRDDSVDLLLGARKDAKNRPKYDGDYYAGGYPPENIGVCTDVIWRAFREAGYSLRDMVDADIVAHREAYPEVTWRDKNIDFRRVINLKHFFERNAMVLTNDIDAIEQWQPGDIVIFRDNHIGMISDRRNREGQPFVLHNAGQWRREEDYLSRGGTITGHYRWDGARLPEPIAWENLK